MEAEAEAEAVEAVLKSTASTSLALTIFGRLFAFGLDCEGMFLRFCFLENW